MALVYLDNEGQVKWTRYTAPAPGQGFATNGGVALPDGFLLSYSWFDLNGNDSYGRLEKVDRRGRVQWIRWFNPNEMPYRAAPVRCPDGSYLLCQQSIYNASSPWTTFSFDYWLTRYAPNGNRLQSGFAGRPRTKDEPYQLAPTSDGGAVLVGASTVRATVPSNSITYGKLIKVDSLLQTEWSVDIAPQWPGASADCWLTSVQPLTNGHYWVGGMTTMPGANPPTTADYVGLIAEIAPPVQPGDTVGRVLGQWYNPDGWFWRGFAGGGDSAYFWGTSTRNRMDYRTYLTKYAGMGTPASVDLCATPPVFPDLAVGWTPAAANPLLFTFAADSAQAHPGPRYAEISRVRWDFGDGAIGYGWQAQHTYATSQPVRARVCVYNNLYCATCHEFFPLGPLGVRQELAAGVRVFPNPSPDGRFTVRVGEGLPVPATLTVYDGVGRVVLTPPVGGAESVVDLRGVPSGVYALRLTWADGRTLTQRLVR